MKKKKFLLVIVVAAFQLYAGIIQPEILQANALCLEHKEIEDVLSPEICINRQVFISTYNDFFNLSFDVDTKIPGVIKKHECVVKTARKKREDNHIPSFLKQDSWVYESILVFEKAIKVMFFNCQMCGQCKLMYTGFICPMQCPKEMNSGPCGGSFEGICELGRLEKTWEKCTWCSIYERLNRWDLLELLDYLEPAPFNNELRGSSSWINAYLGKIKTPDKQLRKKVAKKIVKYYKQKVVNIFKIKPADNHGCKPRSKTPNSDVDQVYTQRDKTNGYLPVCLDIRLAKTEFIQLSI